MMNDTLARLLADVTGIDRGEITPELSRSENDRWDSLNHLRLITAVEESFSVRFTMDEIEHIDSLADIERLLTERAA
jgi:acyl carrier protein